MGDVGRFRFLGFIVSRDSYMNMWEVIQPASATIHLHPNDTKGNLTSTKSDFRTLIAGTIFSWASKHYYRVEIDSEKHF